jgi:transaldolase
MEETVIHKLTRFGVSVWLDNISRSLIERGKLKQMIKEGLRGMTSNPTIFDKSISSTSDYDGKILQLSRENKSTFEIYDNLTVKDVQDAADIFMPVYEMTGGLDGYVSLEVNPHLAYNTNETIEEGKRLYHKVGRPNVMFKVPTTDEGFKAIEELIALGINVNATLIFSLEQYINTAEAYIKGIKRFVASGGDSRKIRSVASVFVSRIDTVVDKILNTKIEGESDIAIKNKLKSLQGKAAVANSALIYKKYLEIFSCDEFKSLSVKGANIQRVLWGSTSTKNPAYSDIKYVTELIGKNTVNTLPEHTFYAFLDHGEIREALTGDTEDAESIIAQLKIIGIDINEVCTKLLRDGVIAFKSSFDALLDTIKAKGKNLCSQC